MLKSISNQLSRILERTVPKFTPVHAGGFIMRLYAVFHRKYEVELITRHVHACKVLGWFNNHSESKRLQHKRLKGLGMRLMNDFLSVNKQTYMCVVTKA